jgi:hypothetical protein
MTWIEFHPPAGGMSRLWRMLRLWRMSVCPRQCGPVDVNLRRVAPAALRFGGLLAYQHVPN